MQIIYQSIIAFYLFMLCVNLGLWYVGNELNIPWVTHHAGENFTQLNAQYNTSAAQYNASASGGAFNTLLIFGDFYKGITNFMAIIDGQYVMNTLNAIGIVDSYLIVPIQAIVGFMVIISLLYLLTGRG